tara:strand:+ start:701 stop:1369 length:669 start_codon:yes stop_codon:yes gene_type:complete
MNKPKYKTTEFWVQITVMVITLAIMSGAIKPGTGIDKGISLIVLTLSTLGYGWARTTIKKAKTQRSLTLKEGTPGYKTSEYWFTAIGIASSAIVTSGAVEGSQVDKVLGVVTAGLASMGYAPMRASLKTHGPKVVFLVSLLFIGCTGPSLKAIQSRYKAIAPEYIEAIHDAPDLSKKEKDTRYLTVETWRIDAELLSKDWSVKRIISNLKEYRLFRTEEEVK